MSQPILEARRCVRRVLPLRECDHAHVESLADCELHAAQGGVLARRIGVKAQEEARRQPAELTQVRFGERRSHRGDDGLEPRLAERDHVGVALHDHRALLLRDRRPGQVEPVEDVAFVEELALGRVHVLAAQRVVVPQLASLEPDDVAACVAEREHQPLREVVVAAGVDEPGVA